MRQTQWRSDGEGGGGGGGGGGGEGGGEGGGGQGGTYVPGRRGLGAPK